MMRAPHVVAVDGGFASMGIARLAYDGARWGLHGTPALLVLTTKKSEKKRRVRAADDNQRRAEDIGAMLAEILDADAPIAVLSEGLSLPRNAGSAVKVGIAWGVLVEACRARGVPMLQASPQEVKLRVCGARDASKAAVQAAVCKLYPHAAARALGAMNKTLREHAADALAVAHTCLTAPEIRAAVRMYTDHRGGV